MLKPAAIATVAAILTAAALPAAADKGASANCRAHAESVARTGAKYGYADRYNVAYAQCMGTISQRHAWVDNRNPYKSSVVGHCPPGVSVMYRGTLYCTN